MDTSDRLIQWLPRAAAASADRFDTLMIAWVVISAIVAVGIFVAMLWLVVRYREDLASTATPPRLTNARLETAWIAIPLAIFLAMGVWGAVEYGALYRLPSDAVPVYAVAKQWMWTLQHANGRREIGELHVPVGRLVRMVMTSQDAIHSFFIPAFRIKQDVLPGRYTAIAFTPTVAGEYRLLCAEYCGTHHASMDAKVIAMDPADYAAWLGRGADVPGSLRKASNCSVDMVAAAVMSAAAMRARAKAREGRETRGPDLAGIYGRVVPLADGRSVIADENYLRDSMLLPRKDVVAGYEPVMPSYAGQIDEESIAAIVHYLRTNGVAR